MTNEERLQRIGLGLNWLTDEVELIQFKRPIMEGGSECSCSRKLDYQEVLSYAFYLLLELDKEGKHQIKSSNMKKRVEFKFFDYDPNEE